MKLQDLLSKIREKGGKLPCAGEMDAYLQEFILNKMPESETLQQAFEVGNIEMEMLYLEGYNFYVKKAYEDSTLIFQWLAILNPFISKYWSGLGGSQFMVKNYEKALKCYAMSALLDCEDPFPHYYAGLCYRELGNTEDKNKALNLAFARASTHSKYDDLKKKIEVVRWAV